MVRFSRLRLRQSPRDVAGWMDRSLAHCVLGEPEKARSAMSVALGLAPNHRVVLRTVARLLVHLGSADEAHALIRRHPRTASDPWLMSAEISLSQILDQPSLHTLRGRRFVADNQAFPGYVSELAAAVASTEKNAGAHGRSRKLYELALIEPTDNVVAQFQYERQADRAKQLSRTGLELPSAVEGRTWKAIGEGNWGLAVGEALKWQADEPFSGRPATAASCAAIIVGNAALAVESAQAGIRANQGDQLLRNNLAVALARAGSLSEAQTEFSLIRKPLQRGYPQFVFEATQGLMHYVSGDRASGAKSYEKAVRSATPIDREIVLMSWVETEWQFAAENREKMRDELKKLGDGLTTSTGKMIFRRLVQSPPPPTGSRALATQNAQLVSKAIFNTSSGGFGSVLSLPASLLEAPPEEKT
jgi:hypothetical protein